MSSLVKLKSKPPRDLRASIMRIGGTRYVVLSYEHNASEPAPQLTRSEHQVAHALLSGLSNAAIGRLRGSSERTVANQVASIFRKLGVHSRTELAARWGHLISPTASAS
jgi:DNA-binding NarL/FixJ family response regulator